MEEIQIEKLVERCETFLRKAGYKESLISRYHYVWRVGIQRYMQERNLAYYNSDIGREYSNNCNDSNGHIRPFDRTLLRSIQMLDDMLDTGCIRRTSRTATKREFCGEIGSQMQDYLHYLAGIRRSKGTIEVYERCLHDFLLYLRDHSVLRIHDISEQCIVGFLQPYTNKQGGFKSLRRWFSYMEDEGVKPDTFKELFDSFPKLRRHQEVPSFYSVEEIKKIESSIKRSSAVGKRNYAIFLLASRLGLRASDIAHLKFNDIDWEKNILTLTTQKTGKVVQLPLLADVGNAIIDYLKYGRPQSNSDSVFLSARAPYTETTKQTVSCGVTRIITKSGVDYSNRRHGPHSMRHSLAGLMLGNGTKLPVISEVLGHKSSESTMTYLQIDIADLQKCALSVPVTEDSFYKQEGGIFYA
ncbi:MAG: site-specific integrase [Bacteroidales bacterium]|nr:site-specific integrase [Bacteroidales bacterium]